MNIRDRAKAAIERITSNKNGAGLEITIKTPDDITSLDLVGTHAKINLGVDQDGNIINSRKAHIAVSEKFLTDASYPIRDTNNEVNISGHKIYIKDSTGRVNSYVIKTSIPDETIGLITCILSDLEE